MKRCMVLGFLFKGKFEHNMSMYGDHSASLFNNLRLILCPKAPIAPLLLAPEVMARRTKANVRSTHKSNWSGCFLQFSTQKRKRKRTLSCQSIAESDSGRIVLKKSAEERPNLLGQDEISQLMKR